LILFIECSCSVPFKKRREESEIPVYITVQHTEAPRLRIAIQQKDQYHGVLGDAGLAAHLGARTLGA
jgi:hypothetical protein